MGIEKLHEKLQRYYLPSYTPFNHIHKDDCIIEKGEESHEMVDHEMHLDLQVLVKRNEEENIGQALIEVERKDEEFFYTKNMADHIPYGSTINIPYSSIDWVDRDTFGVNNVGGEEFNFCNKLFVVPGIVLTCGKPQRFSFQPLDTFHTHAHEVNSDFLCLIIV